MLAAMFLQCSNNVPVLAATFLDPEYQVLLTEEQQNSGKLELQALLMKDFCY